MVLALIAEPSPDAHECTDGVRLMRDDAARALRRAAADVWRSYLQGICSVKHRRPPPCMLRIKKF
ncbi:protein FAM, partial [Clarias magur]